MTDAGNRSCGGPQWVISMHWVGLDPETAVLRRISVLSLYSARLARDDEWMHSIEEDVMPEPGLSVRIGSTTLVHLGGVDWVYSQTAGGSHGGW